MSKRKATDGLPTNLLAVLGLYSIWRALCGKSRFDMPEGSGYKAGMELKSQGWDGKVPVVRMFEILEKLGITRDQWLKLTPQQQGKAIRKVMTPKK